MAIRKLKDETIEEVIEKAKPEETSFDVLKIMQHLSEMQPMKDTFYSHRETANLINQNLNALSKGLIEIASYLSKKGK